MTVRLIERIASQIVPHVRAHGKLEFHVLWLKIISADADRRHSAASTRRDTREIVNSRRKPDDKNAVKRSGRAAAS